MKNRSHQRINLNIPAADVGFYESQNGSNDKDAAEVPAGGRTNEKEIRAQISREIENE